MPEYQDIKNPCSPENNYSKTYVCASTWITIYGPRFNAYSLCDIVEQFTHLV